MSMHARRRHPDPAKPIVVHIAEVISQLVQGIMVDARLIDNDVVVGRRE